MVDVHGAAHGRRRLAPAGRCAFVRWPYSGWSLALFGLSWHQGASSAGCPGRRVEGARSSAHGNTRSLLLTCHPTFRPQPKQPSFSYTVSTATAGAPDSVRMQAVKFTEQLVLLLTAPTAPPPPAGAAASAGAVLHHDSARTLYGRPALRKCHACIRCLRVWTPAVLTRSRCMSAVFMPSARPHSAGGLCACPLNAGCPHTA